MTGHTELRRLAEAAIAWEGDLAAYIAAANPQAILALLDELEQWRRIAWKLQVAQSAHEGVDEDLRQTAEAATRHAEWWRREALRAHEGGDGTNEPSA